MKRFISTNRDLFNMGIHHNIAEKLGYRLKRKKRSHDFLDLHLSQLFSSLKTDCVIDVGANVGQYGMFLRKLGYKGMILSFEPLKETFDLLQQNSQNDKMWNVYNYGLSNEVASKEINILGRNGGTSFSSLNNPKFENMSYFNINDVSKKEVISLKTLDSQWVSLNLQDFHSIHLKMDTQGHDLNVFMGISDQNLLNIKSLQSEVSFKPIYEGMPPYYDSLKTFSERGYCPSGFFPVSRNKKELWLFESDVIMVKN